MRRFVRGLVLPFLSLLVAGTADAGSFRVRGNVLYVNGIPVLQMRASSHGCDGVTRLTRVADNLGRAAPAEPVTVHPDGSDRVILVGSVACVTVTRADGKRSATTPAILANAWATRLRDALRLPPLKFVEPGLVVPVGVGREVRVVGSMADELSAASTSDRVIKVRRSGGGVLVSAVGVGTAEVVVSSHGFEKSLNVKVLPWAAHLPETVTAEVTGIPTAGATVAGAVKAALRRNLQGRPGAKFAYAFSTAAALPVGSSRSYAVPVRAAAPGALPVWAKVNVEVVNVPVPRELDAELWYSNNPEVVTHPMNLFAANLRQGAPARLLYHHINGATQAMYFRVEAINASDDPARIAIVPGDAKPDGNPVLAGLEAANQYFRAWTVGSAELVTIPPHCSMPVSFHRLAPGDTASGLCGLRLVSGPPELLVRTDAFPPFALDQLWRPALQSSTPWREVGCPPVSDFDRAPYQISEHIYPNPYKSDEMSYAVGGRYGFFRIGMLPIRRQDKGSQLDGNFGVIYKIKAAMTNPTTEPTDVEVVFQASAGYSGGLFLIDGNFIRTPLLPPKDEARLGRYRLLPGASRRLDITTIPLSGSSYPATLLIRPIIKSEDPPVRRNPILRSSNSHRGKK